MITIARDRLYRSLKAALPFAYNDDLDATRQNLRGVYIETTTDGQVHFVATDGHAMIVATPPARVTRGGASSSILLGAADAAAMVKRYRPVRKGDHEQELDLTISQPHGSIGGTHLMVGRHPGLPWTPEDHTGSRLKYAPWRHVMPPRVDIGDSGRVTKRAAPVSLGVSAALLRRAGTAAADFIGDPGAMDGLELRVPDDALAPLLFTYAHPDRGDLWIVVMPMRL